jgi:hypothetical protein
MSLRLCVTSGGAFLMDALRQNDYMQLVSSCFPAQIAVPVSSSSTYRFALLLQRRRLALFGCYDNLSPTANCSAVLTGTTGCSAVSLKSTRLFLNRSWLSSRHLRRVMRPRLPRRLFRILRSRLLFRSLSFPQQAALVADRRRSLVGQPCSTA